MKNKKGSHFFIVLPILLPTLILITALILYFIGKSNYTATKVYEANWNIDIPNSFNEIYNAKTPPAFDGGKKFTVYSVNKSSDFFDDFSAVKNTDIEKEFLDNIESLDITDKYIPEFDKKYQYKKIISNTDENDWLIIIFFAEKNQCIFTQYMQ